MGMHETYSMQYSKARYLTIVTLCSSFPTTIVWPEHCKWHVMALKGRQQGNIAGTAPGKRLHS